LSVRSPTNFEALAKREDIEELENRSRVNLAEPARFWLDLSVKKPGAVHDKRTISRWGYLLKTLDFLEEHQLVRVIQERQVSRSSASAARLLIIIITGITRI